MTRKAPRRERRRIGLSCFSSAMAKTGLETGRGGARDRATHPSVLLPLVRREHYPGLYYHVGALHEPLRHDLRGPVRHRGRPLPRGMSVGPLARSSSQRPLGASRVASRLPPGPVAEGARRAVGDTLLDAPRSFTGSFDRRARAARPHEWRDSRGRAACLNSRENSPFDVTADRPRSRRASILCFWADWFAVRVT